MTIDQQRIADAILTAPSWALLAVTCPSARLREEGRSELASHLYSTLYRPIGEDAQLPLPL